MSKAFLGSMTASNSGHLVLISSVLGVMGRASLAPYCASKFATTGKSTLCVKTSKRTVPCSTMRLKIYINDIFQISYPKVECHLAPSIKVFNIVWSGFADALTQELREEGLDGVKITIVHPFLVGNITDVTVNIRY